MERYLIPNGPMPTIAAQAVMTTGVVIKTLLQVKLGSNIGRASILEWGTSFDGSAAATPIRCELLTTGAIKATVTEHIASGIINTDPAGPAPVDDFPFAFGAAGDETGYDASAEGAIVATRMLDFELVAPTNQWVNKWLSRERMFDADEFLRIRVTAAAAVNAYCWVVVEV